MSAVSQVVMSKRVVTILGSITALNVVLWLSLTPFVFSQSKSNQQDQKPPETTKQDIIKVDTSLVNVQAIVTDATGRFVTGLERGDFVVREDGRLQEIANFSSTETPFNVALLIDTSHSTHNRLPTIRKAASAFIKQLHPQDRVLVVSFDERVVFHGDFTNDHRELEHEIGSLKSSYATSLYDAVYRTITEKLASLPGRKAIVLLTDGVDTYSKQATYDSALDLIASTGIITYTIQYDTRNDGGPLIIPKALPQIIRQFSFASSFAPALGSSWLGQSQAPPVRVEPPAEKKPPSFQLPSPTPVPSTSAATANQQAAKRRDPYLTADEFLRALAVQSGARYIRAEIIENTPQAFALIADELRHQYTLAYYSANEKREGQYHEIEVSIKRRDLSVRARQGYRVLKTEASDSEGKNSEKKSGEIK